MILLGSFSNTIAPSMKIGYAVLPEQILKLWAASKTFYANRVSRAEQVTLSKFIDLGYYEQHVGYMRSIYREKLNTLKTAFSESELSAHTKLSGDEAGMFCLAEFDIDGRRKRKLKAFTQRRYKGESAQLKHWDPVARALSRKRLCNRLRRT